MYYKQTGTFSTKVVFAIALFLFLVVIGSYVAYTLKNVGVKDYEIASLKEDTRVQEEVKTFDSENKALYQAQVAGSNGFLKSLRANSDRLQDEAKLFEETEPAGDEQFCVKEGEQCPAQCVL